MLVYMNNVYYSTVLVRGTRAGFCGARLVHRWRRVRARHVGRGGHRATPGHHIPRRASTRVLLLSCSARGAQVHLRLTITFRPYRLKRPLEKPFLLRNWAALTSTAGYQCTRSPLEPHFLIYTTVSMYFVMCYHKTHEHNQYREPLPINSLVYEHIYS